MHSPLLASATLFVNYVIQMATAITIVSSLIQLLRKKMTASPDNITLFLAMPLFLGIASHFYLLYNLPSLMATKITQPWQWESRGVLNRLIIDLKNKKYTLYRQTASETQLGEMNNRIKFRDTLSGATSEFTIATETEPTLLQHFCIYLYEFPADNRYVTFVEMQGPFRPTLYLGQNESIPLH